MKHLIYYIVVAVCAVALTSCGSDEIPTVKKERKHIRAGNGHYDDKHYAEAEVEYMKALQEAPSSPIARYNMALSMLRQGDMSRKTDGGDSLVNNAMRLLDEVARARVTPELSSHAFYALGNVAYAREDYDAAIEQYKNALRCDPMDDEARDNLRLAQLKKQQQQQDQNGGGGGGNNDQNNDDKQDQDKDQQDQDKQDQNKDQQDQDKQDQNKDQQQNQQQNQQNQNAQQQQGGMSEQNMEQILQTMQNRENATQQRVNAERAAEQRRERARTNKKW